ncbi:hypothetical protein INT43_008720 [Umbelopsis isabellina]|uniref:ABC transporter domain-containing protein n=1 Tax=Mortierella isabellina TaxID=91625 RepID=A0A8H7PWI9_MORIS|nr:hypothetical protein INT43_008720 [Umbelopsis isabellina]
MVALATIRDSAPAQPAGAVRIVQNHCVVLSERRIENHDKASSVNVSQGSWGGVNCNVCLADTSCGNLKGDNATCITTGIGLKNMNAWCDTTNIPWIDNTHVSLQCEWQDNECVFQFWKDYEEQFYCHLTECEQETTGEFDVHGSCAKASCGCMKGAWMCGGEIDMSELVKNVNGPSEWYCTAGKDCWYNEYSTLKDVFPDNIGLSCQVGECANEQDFRDYANAEFQKKHFSRLIELYIVLALIFVVGIIWIATRMTMRRQQKIFGDGSIRLDEDDDTAYFDDEVKLTEITFDDVTYTVGGKQILKSISGYLEPGKLLAIMGPSGAGKSSLLDILARKPKRGVISGRILINGEVPTRKQFKRISSYVDQEDTLIGTLTVRETLMYSALLRLPRTIPLAIKQKRVEETIRELGLTHVADSYIGVAGKRSLSGGEKRRVSIGKELVTSPSILFLDEPTSGLDAYNASVVMECLLRLARNSRRTIITTIHQPRSNIFKMFDSFMLLANGHTVYFGPAKAASQYFVNIGYPVPPDYNIADYLIDVTMNKPSPSHTPQQQQSRSSRRIPFLSGRGRAASSTSIVSTRSLADLNPSHDSPNHNGNDQMDDDNETDAIISDTVQRISQTHPSIAGDMDLLSDSNNLYTLLEAYKNSSLASSIRAHIDSANDTADATSSRSQPYSLLMSYYTENVPSISLRRYFHELSLLSSRTFLNLYRNPFLFFAHISIAIILGLLLGSLFWQVDVDLSGVQNRLGVLFFMCALLGFASTSALDMFSKERVLFMRERENGYYSPASYFTAKVLFDIIPLRILPPLAMGSVSYYMIGLNPNIYVFMKFLMVLVLFNLVSAAVCLCFATAFKSVATANLLANLTILFSMLFGGFLLNKDHIPPVLSWLQHFSFFNYGYEALIVNELKDITLVDKSIADIQIPGPIILSRFGFDGQAFWKDVMYLVIYLAVTMTAAFAFLKFLVKEQR